MTDSFFEDVMRGGDPDLLPLLTQNHSVSQEQLRRLAQQRPDLVGLIQQHPNSPQEITARALVALAPPATLRTFLQAVGATEEQIRRFSELRRTATSETVGDLWDAVAAQKPQS